MAQSASFSVVSITGLYSRETLERGAVVRVQTALSRALEKLTVHAYLQINIQVLTGLVLQQQT